MLGRSAALLAAAVFASFAGGAGAQQISDLPGLDTPAEQDLRVPVAPTILTVDIDRLFTQSQFGQRISQEYNAQSDALVAENRRIADGLRAEELALAAQRPEMDPALFRSEAAAFDEKAQGIRRAQDAKRAALDASLADARAQFLEVTQPVLGDLMVDRGAFAILDRRLVLLSLGSIDVTEDAIERIDAAIGDGMGAPLTPAPESGDPDTTPDP